MSMKVALYARVSKALVERLYALKFKGAGKEQARTNTGQFDRLGQNVPNRDVYAEVAREE